MDLRKSSSYLQRPLGLVDNGAAAFLHLTVNAPFAIGRSRQFFIAIRS